MIVTINRQFGSGGREIARKLSEKLDYPFYDKKIISKLVEKCGIDPDCAEDISQGIATGIGFTDMASSFLLYQQELPMQLQIEEHNIIQDLGKENNGVFLGRRADYILEDKNPFRIFIYSSDIKTRVARCLKYESEHFGKGKTFKDMEKEIHKIDEIRRKYYERYTGDKWSQADNYNICVDTSKLPSEDIIEILALAIEKANKLGGSKNV